MRVYVWDRCFLAQAGSFSTGRRPKPHKRLSATIIVATGKPFGMEVSGLSARTHEGLLLAPNVSRISLEARDSDLSILDAGITTATYEALAPCLIQGQARALSAQELARIKPMLKAAFAAEMTCMQATALLDEVVGALGGGARTVERDARIGRVMQLIEDLPLDELSLPMLARAAGVSASRLRVLFQANLGCGPAQYMRWANAWKAIRLWQKGMKFTYLAHEIGFHDLAHIDHAIGELFGMSPSSLTTAQGVSFHKCGS